MGQRKFLAASMYSMRGSLHRQQAPHWRHPPEIRLDDPVSIPVLTRYSAPTTRFGGFGLGCFRFRPRARPWPLLPRIQQNIKRPGPQVVPPSTTYWVGALAGGSSTTYWVGAGHCANDGAYIEPIKNCANKPGTTAESSRVSHPAGLIASYLGNGGRCVAYSRRLRLRRRS